LIVGSAPQEKAGAASGISETASELGGALGIAILGSIGIAVYRYDISKNLPQNIPHEVLESAKDTLGAAVVVSQSLPGKTGQEIIEVAKNAFVDGMQTVAVIGTIFAVFSAIICMRILKNVRKMS